jgi:hypothetical protein
MMELQDLPDSPPHRSTPINRIYQSHRFFSKLIEPGFFKNERRNIASTIWLDGVCPWKCGGYSFMPLTMQVLNIPEPFRSSPQNLIVCALISGPSHPETINAVLKPLAEHCNDLKEHGFTCFDAYKAEDFTLRVATIAFRADYVAHCLALCRLGVGCFPGCPKCMLMVTHQISGFCVSNTIFVSNAIFVFFFFFFKGKILPFVKKGCV